MTTLVRTIRQVGLAPASRLSPSFFRGLPLVALLILITMVPGAWHAALRSLGDAYLSVSVFVAGTMILVFALERGFNADMGEWLQSHSQWQVPAGALLGSFPGCGGAIVAITQFTRGYLSFGGVVATLTSTMGDAMFLLLAREPATAFGIMAMGVVVGVVSGYIVDLVHGTEFMHPATRRGAADAVVRKRDWFPRRLSMAERAWVALMLPGLVVGLLAAFQIDIDQFFPGSPARLLGMAGALLAMLMWVANGDSMTAESPCDQGGVCPSESEPIMRSLINDTNFITAWVVFAFVGYEMVISALGIDLAALLGVWRPLVPAMAIAVGFIPGCGPQIMVTTLYISGSIPLSAQLGNAISNDGDALFPAIAVAPRAAFVATIYSSIPAVLVAYGWYWLFE